MKRLWISVVVVMTAVGVGIGYRVGGARANGIPPTGALSYTGRLLTFGQPDNASHTISVALWVPGATTAACGSQPGPVTTLNGQFTVTLPDACVPIVHQNANLQVEATIDGTPLGLATLGATPYTVEADTASNPSAGSTLSMLDPTGTIIAWGGTSTAAPAGWLFCSGQAVSRTTYAALFATIGSSNGSGDGSTTFNVPDFRGRFLRGADAGTGRDPDASSRTAMATGGNTGNAVGTVESSQYASHNHGLSDPGHSHWVPAGVYADSQGQPNNASGTYTGIAGGGSYGFRYSGAGNSAVPLTNTVGTGITLAASGGNETRPVNAAVNYLIKY